MEPTSRQLQSKDVRRRPCHTVSLLFTSLSFAGVSALAQVPGSQGPERAGTTELYGSIQESKSETIKFDGGASVRVDDDVWGAFGVGYNVDEHWQVGLEATFSTVDYSGVAASADDPPANQVAVSGSVNASSIGAVVTYHIFPGSLTPYVSSGIGWATVDTNIAEGPPVVGCWWDPWYGYICGAVVNTVTEDALTYSLGFGLRWEPSNVLFLKAGYNRRRFDFNQTESTLDLDVLRFDVGARF